MSIRNRTKNKPCKTIGCVAHPRKGPYCSYCQRGLKQQDRLTRADIIPGYVRLVDEAIVRNDPWARYEDSMDGT